MPINTVGSDRVGAAKGDKPDLLAGFLTKSQLATTLSVSERTIDRWVSLRQFPKPAKIGRLILWRQESVIDHLARLAADGETNNASTTHRRRQ